MDLDLTPQRVLPNQPATLVGRVWLPGSPAGPAIVAVGEDGVYDLTAQAPTMADLLNAPDSQALAAAGERLCGIAELLANSDARSRNESQPWLLAPVDLQAIKACGVTFVKSMLERVIEERAEGDPAEAAAIRQSLVAEIGADLSTVTPGSAEAESVKQVLIEKGLWSPYLEVGIGPYAEVFSKAQPMSALGLGETVGLHPDSVWNNPEPEIAMVVSADGRIVGATLGNDVNLRDFEGRSALLLGRAKDNNGSCALGPFIRLFDEGFGLDQVRNCTVGLEVTGEDGYSLREKSSLSEISRDPSDLVAQTIGSNHQYPDGLVLFTGTMFAPVDDRDEVGAGFSHKLGDVVTISAPEFGALINRVGRSDQIAPWTFGAGALMKNLAARGLL
ncbi:MAG: fumarylacetoacetate hydrolase family protein [Alphaproteobacteria bacterium]|jgi:fumarylacetoacetate (FAA) hydrolase family protein|nr:fumarylacetoacetate hydrolase family protein [Alphaproteobacteria bacterium]